MFFTDSCRHDNNGNGFGLRSVAQGLNDLIPIDFRHFKIGDDQMIRFGCGLSKALLPIYCRFHLIAGRLQHSAHEFSNAERIINQQNARGFRFRCESTSLHRFAMFQLRGLRGKRQ